MTSYVQTFPLTYTSHINGGIVFWDDDKGNIRSSARDFFGVGNHIAAYAARHPEDARAGEGVSAMDACTKAERESLAALLAEIREKCPFSPCSTVTLKEPYNRSDRLFVSKIAGHASGKGISFALVGRMMKKDGSFKVGSVIALESDIALPGNGQEEIQ